MLTYIKYIRNDMVFEDAGPDMDDFYLQLKQLERCGAVIIISMVHKGTVATH
jgi:hypothetical protein